MKRLSLLLLFTGVLSLPQCNPCRCPDVEDDHFDITDLETVHFSATGGFIDVQQPIRKEDYAGIALSFDVEHIAHRHIQNPFSNSAHACSCVSPGWAGSKHEAFQHIFITTEEALGDQLAAGDTVTHLFSIEWELDTFAISDFIAADTGMIRYQRYNLRLNAFPSGDIEAMEFLVRVELTNGEVYSDNTGKVFFQP